MYFLLSEDGLGEVEKVLLRERAFIATSEFFECITFGDGRVAQNRSSGLGLASVWVELIHLSPHLKRRLCPMTFRARRWHLAAER